uniref:Calpain catalytic domain-containing protein n=1 Tax=Mesocestoides corti TaxID=53468 RepID=A0A5K3ERX6_MESCO
MLTLTVYFLLGFATLTTCLAFLCIFIVSQTDMEVNKYFRDMVKKLKLCGPQKETYYDHSISIADKEGFAYLWRTKQDGFWKMLITGLQKHRENSNSSRRRLKRYQDDIFKVMPTKSKHNNFIRQNTVVRMHLPFAHDLTSFISMVDGKM